MIFEMRASHAANGDIATLGLVALGGEDSVFNVVAVVAMDGTNALAEVLKEDLFLESEGFGATGDAVGSIGVSDLESMPE